MINEPNKIDECIKCGITGPLDKDNKCSVCGDKDNN
jgi:hypothetical protein